MSWWEDLYGFARRPLLPEDVGLEKNSKLEKFYKQTLRPMSDPITTGLLSLPATRIVKGIGRIAKSGGKYAAGQKDLERGMYFSLLSSPQTILRAGMGSLTGAAVGMGKLAKEGNFSGAATVGKELLNPMLVAKRAKQGYLHGHRAPDPKVGSMGKNPLNPVDIPSRLLGAMDEVTVEAMKSGGIAEDAARRLTLGGPLESEKAKKVMQFIEDIPQLKFASPFARVGLHSIEQSLRTRPRQIASGLLGYGAYQLGEHIPPEYTPYVAAMGGPFTLPVAAGLAARHSSEAGKDWRSAIGEELSRNIPLPVISAKDVTRPWTVNLASSFTPNLLRDIAKAEDPYERDVRGVKLGSTMQKIPGLRAQLDTKSRKRDIFGNSVAEREDSALKRFFTSEPYRYDPSPNTPEVEDAERLGVKMKPPKFEKSIKVGGQKLELKPEERESYQEERGKGLEVVLKKLYANPKFQALDDEEKKLVLTELYNQTRKSARENAKIKVLSGRKKKKEGE